MISLSEEWAALSRAMYGEEFIDELVNLLRENNVETILECGCGDGNILNGLAKRGFTGMGIDASPVMINMAKERSSHRNISFLECDWLDFWKDHLSKYDFKFDCVMCRGNSLGYVKTWNKKYNKRMLSEPFKLTKLGLYFNKIINSIDLMFNKYLSEKGMLYIDTVSEQEINKGDQEIEINLPNIKLKAELIYEWGTRYVCGEGLVNGKLFKGEIISYLLEPELLEKRIKLHNPTKIWTPKLQHETNYDVICAIK